MSWVSDRAWQVGLVVWELDSELCLFFWVDDRLLARFLARHEIFDSRFNVFAGNVLIRFLLRLLWSRGFVWLVMHE